MRKPIRMRTIVLILIGIYIFGLIGGVWLITFLSGNSKRSHLVEMADKIVNEYIETGELDAHRMFGILAAVYSSDGVLTEVYQESDRIVFHFEQDPKKIDKILSGESVTWLEFMVKDNSVNGYTSLECVGVPITVDGIVIGAFFWAREQRNLLESLLGYTCAFTVVFIVAVVFLLLNLRRQRQDAQMRQHYVDNITHELKSPIASIKALAEALSDGMEKSPTDRNVYYGMILHEANRQERMICDVLELSKLQSNQKAVHMRPVKAEQVFIPVCEKYAAMCDLMDVEFIVSDTAKNLPALYTDEEYLPMVLDVLLSNALKFVQPNGTIQVDAVISRKRVAICVKDNGCGISKEEMPHIFERFYKGFRSDNESGSGLGLSIAKEIVESMGESIWLSNNDGGGTTASFTVALSTDSKKRNIYS